MPLRGREDSTVLWGVSYQLNNTDVARLISAGLIVHWVDCNFLMISGFHLYIDLVEILGHQRFLIYHMQTWSTEVPEEKLSSGEEE